MTLLRSVTENNPRKYLDPSQRRPSRTLARDEKKMGATVQAASLEIETAAPEAQIGKSGCDVNHHVCSLTLVPVRLSDLMDSDSVRSQGCSGKRKQTRSYLALELSWRHGSINDAQCLARLGILTRSLGLMHLSHHWCSYHTLFFCTLIIFASLFEAFVHIKNIL